MARFYPIGATGGGAGSDDCTATAAELLKGYTGILKGSDDEPVQGTLELTGNAQAAHVLNGETFYTNNAKSKQTGTMPNRGDYNGWGNSKGNDAGNQRMWVKIPQGYYNENANVFLSWADIRNMAGITADKIKKNESIMGIIGSFEGWVPNPQDLYYNGVNSAGFTLGDGQGWYFENTRIHYKPSSISGNTKAVVFSRAIDVRSYSKLILEGYFNWSLNSNQYIMLYTQTSFGDIEVRFKNPANIVEFNISQVTTINAGGWLGIGASVSEQWITRIRLA